MSVKCLFVDFKAIESGVNKSKSKQTATLTLVGNKPRCIINEDSHSKLCTKQDKYAGISYITRKEVCEMLHISYPTLHRLVNRGVLPCLKIGRRSLFDISVVRAAIVKRNVDSSGYA